MKARSGFIKAKLGEQVYVIPYGQNIVDYCDSMLLNETGEILWDGLEQHSTREELARLLLQEYQLEPDKETELLSDVDSFLRQLVSLGMAEEEQSIFYGWKEQFFTAGPLNVSYQGPEIVYNNYFQKFASDKQDGVCDLTVQISCIQPRFHKNGKVILRNEEVILIDIGEEYLFLFPKFEVLNEMQVKKDGSYALLFCQADFINERAEDIFHVIRFAFLIAASEKELFLLHSASFLYQGKAWLFSGRSGTGKSTHTNLWKEYYGVELLNGDLNMLGIENGQAVVYGQPWCGTSGICTAKAYPLGGITFLKQAPENVCTEMPLSEKILAILQRMISPAWKEHLLQRNIDFAEKLGRACPVWRLHCTPEREAANVMKKEIDKVCNQSTELKNDII